MERQLTYNGRTLYYYVGDKRRGQILCRDLHEFGGTWLVLRARVNSSGSEPSRVTAWNRSVTERGRPATGGPLPLPAPNVEHSGRGAEARNSREPDRARPRRRGIRRVALQAVPQLIAQVLCSVAWFDIQKSVYLSHA